MSDVYRTQLSVTNDRTAAATKVGGSHWNSFQKKKFEIHLKC